MLVLSFSMPGVVLVLLLPLSFLFLAEIVKAAVVHVVVALLFVL